MVLYNQAPLASTLDTLLSWRWHSVRLRRLSPFLWIISTRKTVQTVAISSTLREGTFMNGQQRSHEFSLFSMLGGTKMTNKGSATRRKNSNRISEHIEEYRTLGKNAVCFRKLGQFKHKQRCEKKSQLEFANESCAPSRELPQFHRIQTLERPLGYFIYPVQ